MVDFVNKCQTRPSLDVDALKRKVIKDYNIFINNLYVLANMVEEYKLDYSLILDEISFIEQNLDNSELIYETFMNYGM